ncbi:hypothetical protein JW911_00330 [Candidatus Peregrinibacteria bacterium]|nr:hypothetical protein [Candidatus Peregrinibacteria bacterium]
MEELVIKKARAAETALQHITESQEEQIKPIIFSIKQIQKKINETCQKHGMADICMSCGGICCVKDMETLCDDDFFFNLFYNIKEETKQKIFRALENNTQQEECAFASPQGCIIPETSRPVICKIFFCNRFGNFKKTISPLASQLCEAVNLLFLKLTELNLRFTKR